MSPTRAWIWLLALSGAATLAGLAETWPILVLGLAGLKARVILAAYLNLQTAPDWLRGFDLGLIALIGLLAALA